MTPKLLAKFIDKQNYDVRVTRNGRWIDQKCAYDALTFVADCIFEYITLNGDRAFTSPQIWKSEYAINNVQAFFGKPDPENPATVDEYNKFYRQPMKLLAASGVLTERKVGIAIEFKVAEIHILEYIAAKDRNSMDFLCLYIEKTLKDSGLLDGFDSFFDEQTISSYQSLKAKFSDFCFEYTPIKNPAEPGRIFAKVLNPLAYKRHLKGTERGRLSRNMMTLNKLQYNQPNWRDVNSGKDKNIARGDFTPAISPQMYKYKMSKAKRNLRSFNDKYNDKRSEVTDKFSIGEVATHMHHIFPQNEFVTISEFIENLIALTPAQHMNLAHPNGNTHIIDEDYQHTCLINKTASIRENLVDDHQSPIIYDFKDFMTVLNVGFNTDHFDRLEPNDFSSVIGGILHYQ